MSLRDKAKSLAEKKVLQSLAREIKIRDLEDENRNQSIIAAATKWDARLEEKDIKASAKRRNNENQQDISIMNKVLKEQRRIRLVELYQQDELKYEQELQAKGLAYRRERY